jgi:hypothetical protein
MCPYFNNVITFISRAVGRSGAYWIAGTSIRLYINVYGEIAYTKYSGRTNKFYSKTIPAITLCQAKIIYDQQGMVGINRIWHNNLPEGKSRGCNLKIIQDILSTFP